MLYSSPKLTRYKHTIYLCRCIPRRCTDVQFHAKQASLVQRKWSTSSITGVHATVCNEEPLDVIVCKSEHEHRSLSLTASKVLFSRLWQHMWQTWKLAWRSWSCWRLSAAACGSEWREENIVGQVWKQTWAERLCHRAKYFFRRSQALCSFSSALQKQNLTRYLGGSGLT